MTNSEGHFGSPAAVVEAALARLMVDPEPPEADEQTLAAIEEGLTQADRGQTMPFERFASAFRRSTWAGSGRPCRCVPGTR